MVVMSTHGRPMEPGGGVRFTRGVSAPCNPVLVEAVMLRRFIFSSTVALFAAVIPAALSAQATDLVRGVGRSSSGRVTLGGSFGGLSGAANLNDAGTADWRLGWVASVNATYWVHPLVGLRASGNWAQDSV